MRQSQTYAVTGSLADVNIVQHPLHQISTLLHQISTLLHQISTLLHQISTLQHQISTLLHQISTLVHQISTLRIQKKPHVNSAENVSKQLIV